MPLHAHAHAHLFAAIVLTRSVNCNSDAALVPTLSPCLLPYRRAARSVHCIESRDAGPKFDNLMTLHGGVWNTQYVGVSLSYMSSQCEY